MVISQEIIAGIFLIAAGYIAAIIKSKYDLKREMIKLAVETAHIDLTEYDLDGETRRVPMSANITFYYCFFDGLHKRKLPHEAMKHAFSEVKKVYQIQFQSGFKYYKHVADALPSSDDQTS